MGALSIENKISKQTSNGVIVSVLELDTNTQKIVIKLHCCKTKKLCFPGENLLKN